MEHNNLGETGTNSHLVHEVLREEDNQLAILRNALDASCDKPGFFERIGDAADRAGYEFLFEIPGALFNTSQTRAAVIRCGGIDTIGDFFILYDQENSAIQVLCGEEVSGEVKRFVRSYAAVLQCLQNSIHSQCIH